jgi:hypothetical protein
LHPENRLPAASTDNTHNYKKNEIGYSAGFVTYFPVKENYSVSIEIINNFAFNNINKSASLNGGTTKTYSTNFLLSIARTIKKRKTRPK